MKNLIFLTLFLFATVSLGAQDFPETVYLKNGNLIRGTIIQMVPGKALEIKSRDGKVYVYKMNEVAKIVKNESATPNSDAAIGNETQSVSTTSTYSRSPKSSRRYVEETAEPMYSSYSDRYMMNSGYRILFDFGYSLSTDVSDLDRFEFTLSQGYQFNPYLFLGAGAGVSVFYEPSSVCFPVFLNPRIDFSMGKVSPFIDLKGGYTFGEDIEGLYMLPSMGARFAFGNRGGVNFSLGYTIQQLKGLGYDYDYDYDQGSRINVGALTLKVGFDF